MNYFPSPYLLPVLLLGMLCLPLSSQSSDIEESATRINKIAFGSCYRPNKNTKIWDTIAAQSPDLFIFSGDNIYADTRDMARMREKYDELLNEEPFRNFRKQVPILATWDDHDYGENDAGAEYPTKVGAKKEFLRAFPFAEDHPIHQREGIYHSVTYGEEGKRVQVILLDTRYFRSAPLSEKKGRRTFYLPNPDPAATILGQAQWLWLENQLKQAADLRFIVSSIQFLHDQHPFEKWANFPLERQKLRKLITPAMTANTVIISGDRHMGEIAADPQGLLEITSSGLTNAGGGRRDEPNRYRIGERVGKRNFGLAEINWESFTVTLKILGEDGQSYQQHSFQFGKAKN